MGATSGRPGPSGPHTPSWSRRCDGRIPWPCAERSTLLVHPTSSAAQGELTVARRMTGRGARPAPRVFAQGQRRRAGSQQSPAGLQGPSKRRASGFHEAHTSLPYVQGAGRVIPGITRRAGYYGRGFSGQRRAAGADTGPELKFHDVDINDAATAATGEILNTGSVNLIAQNTTEIGRIGRKCVIKSINWRFQVTLPQQVDAADISGGDTYRLIMYLDKQCNGATAAVTGILESTDFQSFNNLANKSRFRILMDRVYTLNRMVAGTDGASTIGTPIFLVNDSFYKNCNIPLEFDAAAGAITEIRSNNIGVMAITLNGTAALNSKLRLRFSDG